MFYLYLLILITFFVIAIPTIYASFIGAPILASPKKAIRESLKNCQIKPGEKLYELGAGTGRAMVIASNEFGARTIGFEMSPLFLLIAKINLFLHNARKARIVLANFYNQNLSDADVVFCFLTPKAMKRLKPKFEKELKRGTRVISYAFSIKGWEEEKIINNGYPGKIFIYLKK